MPKKPAPTILLAGGTGLVGHALTRVLLAQSPRPRLIQLVRRVPDGADARATWQTVDFAALPTKLSAAQVACCCLGTTIKQAGSQQAFRAVDFDAVLAFARAAHDAGVRRFGVVSAHGASTTSRLFYNRVKAEMEAALSTLGFASLVIARPSLLLGDRATLGQPSRAGERVAAIAAARLGWLMPNSVRPIEAATVARALWLALQQARPGVRVLESAEMQTAGAAL